MSTFSNLIETEFIREHEAIIINSIRQMTGWALSAIRKRSVPSSSSSDEKDESPVKKQKTDTLLVSEKGHNSRREPRSIVLGFFTYTEREIDGAYCDSEINYGDCTIVKTIPGVVKVGELVPSIIVDYEAGTIVINPVADPISLSLAYCLIGATAK